MSLVHFQFESQCLCSNTDVTVILPDKPRDISPAEFYASGKKYRVLWLLHGTFGDLIPTGSANRTSSFTPASAT